LGKLLTLCITFTIVKEHEFKYVVYLDPMMRNSDSALQIKVMFCCIKFYGVLFGKFLPNDSVFELHIYSEAWDLPKNNQLKFKVYINVMYTTTTTTKNKLIPLIQQIETL
jgi:hypothetical protein